RGDRPHGRAADGAGPCRWRWKRRGCCRDAGRGDPDADRAWERDREPERDALRRSRDPAPAGDPGPDADRAWGSDRAAGPAAGPGPDRPPPDAAVWAWPAA